MPKLTQLPRLRLMVFSTTKNYTIYKRMITREPVIIFKSIKSVGYRLINSINNHMFKYMDME